LDSEIEVLRTKLKSAIENDPDNLRLISFASLSLARLLKAHDKLEVEQSQGEKLKTAVNNVIRDFALPLGAGDMIRRRQAELLKEEELRR
jgi:hypothetical protein